MIWLPINIMLLLSIPAIAIFQYLMLSRSLYIDQALSSLRDLRHDANIQFYQQALVERRHVDASSSSAFDNFISILDSIIANFESSKSELPPYNPFVKPSPATARHLKMIEGFEVNHHKNLIALKSRLIDLLTTFSAHKKIINSDPGKRQIDEMPTFKKALLVEYP